MPEMMATKADFDGALSAAGDQLVVVDFTASWCGPCQMIAPKFAEIDAENSDVTCIKVDVDENSEVAGEQGINCMPTFKFYKNGECVFTMEGANEAGLRAKIAELK